MNSYVYEVLILLLFIQTYKTVFKPDILDAATCPAVAGCYSFDSIYRTQKLEEDGRTKTEVIHEERMISKMK